MRISDWSSDVCSSDLLTPVALAAMNYLALISRVDAPFKTVDEMTAWAKANPGKLTIGTTSMGGLPHMSFESLALMSGLKFMNVPYKGNAAEIGRESWKHRGSQYV